MRSIAPGTRPRLEMRQRHDRRHADQKLEPIPANKVMLFITEPVATQRD